jgi:hypothetical protein
MRNTIFEINRLRVYCRLGKVTLWSGLIDSLLSHCRYHMLCPAHPVLCVVLGNKRAGVDINAVLRLRIRGVLLHRVYI